MEIFNNKQLQNEFDVNGFVCIPALNAGQIAHLTQLYSEVKPKSHPGIYSNVQDQPAELNQKIGAAFKNAFASFISSNLKDVQIAGCSYLVKHTGIGSQSEMHQDYTLVDEAKYLSLSIWCPMVDVDEKNGCLQVIPGSHKWFTPIRSANISSLYLGFNDRLQKHLKPVPVKAGTAVLYAHNLFHGSKPNLSDRTRISSTISITHEEADLSHFFKQEGHILQVEIDEHFYYTTMPVFRSEGKLMDVKELKKLDLSAAQGITEEKFFETLEVQSKTNRGMWNSVKRLLRK